MQCNSTPSSKKRKSIEISRKRTASPATASIKKTKKTSSSSATPPIKKTKRITHVSSTPIKRIEKTTPSSPTPIEKAHRNSPSLTSLPHFEKVVRPYSSNYMVSTKHYLDVHMLFLLLGQSRFSTLIFHFCLMGTKAFVLCLILPFCGFICSSALTCACE